MRRVDSTPYSWLVGGESDRGTKRVALSQPCRDERVYLCLLSVYFFCPSSPFSHVISSIGRVMAGISRREVSSEFQPWLAGNSRSTWLGPCKVPSEFFFFISNSKYPCRVDISIPQSRYLTFSIRQMTEVVSRREHCCKLQQTCHEESSSSQECFSTFNRGLLRLSKSCRKLIFVTSSIFATGGGKVASAYSQ